MDPNQRNGAAMRKRIQTHIATLITSFESLLEDAMPESREQRTDLLASMDRGLQADLQVQNMIRATEDLAVLIRAMEELWIFGTLNTRHDADAQQPEELTGLINRLLDQAAKSLATQK